MVPQITTPRRSTIEATNTDDHESLINDQLLPKSRPRIRKTRWGPPVENLETPAPDDQELAINRQNPEEVDSLSVTDSRQPSRRNSVQSIPPSDRILRKRPSGSREDTEDAPQIRKKRSKTNGMYLFIKYKFITIIAASLDIILIRW
jgi:hypothetical protein